ncbi:histidine kinase [Streptomyces sp. RS10V-4]|uniref:sensor histidine kinase n=1 Tax=Streptomyces rhizoryzae TaxID=2932493 RepID=UPI00200618D5|nr:histidine kinase [Streptomyces rhizoryzae]MCK7622347.1 histidine kinase [Streptomyces rhizoryzae]
MRLGRLPHPAFQLLALLVGAALFPLRRRLPEAVLLALAVLTGLAPGVGPITAVTAYTVARRTVRTRRLMRLLLAAGALVLASAAAAAPWLGPGSVPYGLALGLALAPTAVIVPGLVGTANGQQGRLVRALRERGAAAERARRFADSEARIHERSRIAAEMHDLVGHRLSLISLHSGGLELALERAAPELREEAVLVRRATRDAMRELRQALGVLGPLGRDTGPDALTDATGTRADIEALVAQSRDGGIAVRLEWTGPDLDTRPAGVRRAVHRVVREALTNVHRYAAAAHVTVRIGHDEDRVRVTVRNGAPPGAGTAPAGAGGRQRPFQGPGSGPGPGQGHGPGAAEAAERAPAGEPSAAGGPAASRGPSGPAAAWDSAAGPGSGRGLTGLRERVELLGGTFEAGGLPTGGFQVVAEVPAEPGEARAPKPPAGPPAAFGTAGGDVPAAWETPPGGAEPALRGRRAVEALPLAFGLVALCVLMVLGTAFVYATRPHQEAGPPPLPHLGMTYQEVAATGVLDNAAVRAAATGHEPPRPAGAAGCLYPFNGGTESRPGSLTITRYCFDAAQRLITIDRFTVPSVRDAAPWETP